MEWGGRGREKVGLGREGEGGEWRESGVVRWVGRERGEWSKGRQWGWGARGDRGGGEQGETEGVGSEGRKRGLGRVGRERRRGVGSESELVLARLTVSQTSSKTKGVVGCSSLRCLLQL